jgi:hypothetical protein
MSLHQQVDIVSSPLITNIYSLNSPVTPLQARTFGVWTLTSAVVRGYAAYHVYDKTYVPNKSVFE